MVLLRNEGGGLVEGLKNDTDILKVFPFDGWPRVGEVF
jgi:hypothetical protein